MAEAAIARGRPPARGRSWRRVLAVVAATLLALVAAANAYVIATTRAQIVAGLAQAPSRPVAVVLGNKVWPNGMPSGGLAERLEVALELHRAGRVQRVIVSGRVGDDYDEPSAMAAWLAARGVPRSAIILDVNGYRTAATMADVAAMGVREALICTHGYHLPRALYLARHAGIDALGVPVAKRGGTAYETVRGFVREALARAETVVEVAWRGVRRSGDQIAGP